MKKRVITAAAFAACLALCAAVWPQNEPVEGIPAAQTPVVVTATTPEVPEVPETVEAVMAENASRVLAPTDLLLVSTEQGMRGYRAVDRRWPCESSAPAVSFPL